MELKVIRHGIPCLLILAATAVIYAQVGSHGFMLIDDSQYVHQNAMVQRGLTLDGFYWAMTGFHAGNWHPLTWLSHMLDITLFGPAPGPQHVVNAVLHALNGVLVYWLSFLLLGNRFASLFAALIFVVHPLHVESVAWISERKDLLCALFYCLSVIAYVLYSRKPGVLRYLAVVLTLILALLAKPMAVSIPAILFLLDWLILDRLRPGAGLSETNLKVVIEKIPLIAITLASIVLTLIAQSGAMVPIEMVSFGGRIMNASVAYVTYLSDMFFPINLFPFYPFSPADFWREFVPSIATLVLVTGVSIILHRRFHWLLFGWLWFLITLLPVIGIVQVGNQSHADRYMYIPSIGLLIIAGAIIGHFLNKRLLVSALALPLLIFHSFLGWIQVGYWSNPYLLWSRAVEQGPGNHFALMGISDYFLRAGRVAEAKEYASRLVAEWPTIPQGFFILGNVYLEQGEFLAAERAFREALQKTIDNPAIMSVVMNNLATAIEHQGRIEEARALYQAAREKNPVLSSANENLKRLEGPQ